MSSCERKMSFCVRNSLFTRKRKNLKMLKLSGTNNAAQHKDYTHVRTVVMYAFNVLIIYIVECY